MITLCGYWSGKGWAVYRKSLDDLLIAFDTNEPDAWDEMSAHLNGRGIRSDWRIVEAWVNEDEWFFARSVRRK